MKKTAVLFAALLLLAAPAFAGWNDQRRNSDPWATKVDTVPKRGQTRFDYTGTTSGYPIYTGHAAVGIASSSTLWRIYKATDSAAGPTLIQFADDVAWDNRASASYS